MAGLKVKSHLEALMGTDVIRLNDRQYMLTLQARLMQEYEHHMDKQVILSYMPLNSPISTKPLLVD